MFRIIQATAILLILITSAAHADRILISVTGAKQGAFKGDDASGKMTAADVTLQMVSPRDPQSGLPTGQVVQRPLHIRRPLGAPMVQFFQAIINNESLPTVVVEFYQTDASGKESLANTIKLTNASVAMVRQQTIGLEQNTPTQVMDVSLAYEKIEMQTPTNLPIRTVPLTVPNLKTPILKR